MVIKIVLIVILILIVFFVGVMIHDCHSLVVRKYEFDVPNISGDISLVMLSDLHGVRFGKNNQKLVDKINALSPDAVVIAGDMYTASEKSGIENAKDFLSELVKTNDIYYADGNHEEKTKELKEEFGNRYEDYVLDLSNKGVKFINNNNVYIEDKNVCIYGLALPFEYYKKFKNITPGKAGIEKLLGEAPAEKAVVLLAHNPEYFKDYAKWGADVVCSGHYHGGLMRLPIVGGVISPRYKLFPRYDYGVYEEGKSHMVLSCGLGTHTLPIRIFNPGEVSYIHLKQV